MYWANQRISFQAAVCLIGFSVSVCANEFPCDDDRCVLGPQQPRPSAAPVEEAPAEEADANPAPVSAAARGPVMFAAPTPNGEVEGARNSYSLPSIEFHFPKWQIGTPEFKIRGIGRGRREAQMRLDEGTAPMASGAPAIYGPLIGAGLQQRMAAPAPAKPAPADAAPAEEEPADAAPAGCIDPCALKRQQEEVRQLTQQVQQLQGLILRLSDKQATSQESQSVEEEEPTGGVSYIPGKARVVSHQTSGASRSKSLARERVRQLQQEEELAALEAETAARQEELEEGYSQKVAELEEMQARMDKLQLEQKRLLEAKLNKIDSERERRLRTRVPRPATKQHEIVQSSNEYEAADEESAIVSPPVKLSRPSNPKPMPRRAKPIAGE